MEGCSCDACLDRFGEEPPSEESLGEAPTLEDLGDRLPVVLFPGHLRERITTHIDIQRFIQTQCPEMNTRLLY